MGNYITNAEVCAFKINGNTVDLTGYNVAEIDTEIVLAEEIVEDITNDRFYAATETNLFDGTGHTRLFFMPEIPYPLISVTTLKELDLDGSTVLETFTENTDFKTYDYYVETARSFDGDRPRRRFGTGGTWAKGQKNIQIIGSWGRSATPAAIDRAVILLVLERLKPGSTKMRQSGVQEAEWDDFRIMFQKGKDIKVGETTGFPEVDRLLSNYVNDINMFQVIPEDAQIYENPPTLT